MKKLFIALIATTFIATTSFGQSLSEAGKKNLAGSQMVTIVTASKLFYVKGQTYEDFVKALALPSPTVPSQDELFRKVYSYVSLGTPDCDIVKSDNTILYRFASDMATIPKNLSTPNATYSERKKWWQILINTVINVALDVLVPVNNETVDLWPDA